MITNWQWSPVMIPLFLGVVASVVSIAFRIRHTSGANRFGVLLSLLGAVWLIGYILEIGRVDLEGKLFAAVIRYCILGLMPTLWSGYVFHYTGRGYWMTRRKWIVAAVISLVTVILILTPEYHGLIWRSVTLENRGGVSVLVPQFGIGFWLLFGCVGLLFLGGIWLLLRMFLQHPALYRQQIQFLLFGTVVITSLISIALLGVNLLPEINLASYAYTVAVVVMNWGVLRVQVGDILPLAHASVITGMADGIVVLDAQARILDLNQAAISLLNLNKPECVGQPFTEIGAPWVETLVQRAQRERATWSQEVTHITDSRPQIFDVRVSQLRDVRGGLVSHVMVWRDITARKQAELEVRERHRHLEAVWGAVPDAIVVLNSKQYIVEWNASAEGLFGYSRREVLGQKLSPLINTAETLAKAEAFLRDMWAGERVQPVETVRAHKNGDLINVVFAGAPVVVDDKLIGAVIVYTDITQRKRIEEDIRTLNEELEARVAARTAELATLNQQLADEVQKHEQAEATLMQRNRELLALQSAAAATSSSLDLSFLLDTVTWEMTNLLQSSGCIIFELDQDGNQVVGVADYEAALSGALGGDVANIGPQPLSDYPLRLRVLNERYAAQVGFSTADAVDQAFMARRDIKSQLLLPMVFQERVVGLVIVTQNERERVFSDREISLGQLLANQAAIAVENARLYDRAHREITERAQAEAKIKASLKEKEILLQEIHHRVKNNLQVISSLLNLQSQGIQDEKTLEVFQESQNRIRSMALIHEKLYRSSDLARVDFAEYIRNLASFLIRSYRSRAVRLDLQAADIYLSIDNAVPCGLIVNELISNALKHAFVDGREGEIRVIMQQLADHQVRLVVRDNGVGLPKDADYMNTGSLGLQLVTMLVEQLDGTIEIRNNVGAEFEIIFSGG
ncbi:MAG: PAS domain S-box protein [Anaerolineae bacterium]|nr:PAS domain S-box protein [Anaerolineae bacterium]